MRLSLKSSDESKALIILLASAFLFSLMGAFMKLSSRDVPSTQLIFYRSTFQGVIVVLGMLFVTEPDNNDDGTNVSSLNTATITRTRLIQYPLGRPKHRSVIIARGFIGGFAFLNYFYALKVLPLGDANTLFSLRPIITIFLARIILGENIVFLNLMAALSSLVGAYLITGSNSNVDNGNPDNDSDTRLGYIAAIVGSVAGSAVLVLTRKAGIAVHTLQLIFSWAIFSIAFSFCVGHSSVGINIEESWHMPHSKEIWGYISGMVIFGSLSHFMMNHAARIAPAGLSAIVRSSNIMWAYLLEIVVFHQVPTANTVIGVILISLSLILIAATKLKEVKGASDSGLVLDMRAAHCNENLADERTPILSPSFDTLKCVPHDDSENATHKNTLPLRL
eukprot:CAMPEP_0194107442 /NCGR_PEP_ID=MMETSP0150-20130528/7310_1 /TAXON_ID=122233 /ORGANISM="Chaetoceros debilis, Strain MM31A-1" /LENGTH=391 /DNA_ID=CAMNT_0038795845 /DNA_START=66 /DNA_END=1241 /DNA_ORIENTATION=+